MSFQIEKGIPAPAKPATAKRYPFDQLQVGDSFLVSLEPPATSWATFFTAIQNAQVRLNIKLTTRLVSERQRRVWRVA